MGASAPANVSLAKTEVRDRIINGTVRVVEPSAIATHLRLK
ncbi:MAG: hypothetical protein SVX43_00745 [Cyanobacteriota bacterium]|nr:hypothetical protein [Cyanobacteriota bacterium]